MFYFKSYKNNYAISHTLYKTKNTAYKAGDFTKYNYDEHAKLNLGEQQESQIKKNWARYAETK